MFGLYKDRKVLAELLSASEEGLSLLQFCLCILPTVCDYNGGHVPPHVRHKPGTNSDEISVVYFYQRL